MSTNIHWLSDALAGALIGYAIGHSVGENFAGLLARAGKKSRIGVYLAPTEAGLSYSF